MPQRRFPPPWIAEEHDACFIVRDRAGLNLAYVYFQDDPGCRSAAKPCRKRSPRSVAGLISVSSATPTIHPAALVYSI